MHRRAAAIAIVLALASVGGCAVSGEGAGASPTSESSAISLPSSEVDWRDGAPSDDPIAMVAWEALMSPDGEYAAEAAYTAVLERHGEVEPYATIRAAEQRHSSALTRQLRRMGVEVPANPWLEQIPAPDDLATAARAWADGEVANIEMYDRLLGRVSDDPMLTRVLTNLRRASERSHLPAFRAAADNGGTLPPERIPRGGPRR